MIHRLISERPAISLAIGGLFAMFVHAFVAEIMRNDRIVRETIADLNERTAEIDAKRDAWIAAEFREGARNA